MENPWSFCFQLAYFKKLKFKGWRESSMVRNTCSSCRGSGFGSQTHKVAYNHLQLQFQGIQCTVLTSAGTGQKRICRQNIHTRNIKLLRDYGLAQWFSTFLMLQSFNTVLGTCVWACLHMGVPTWRWGSSDSVPEAIQTMCFLLALGGPLWKGHSAPRLRTAGLR